MKKFIYFVLVFGLIIIGCSSILSKAEIIIPYESDTVMIQGDYMDPENPITLHVGNPIYSDSISVSEVCDSTNFEFIFYVGDGIDIVLYKDVIGAPDQILKSYNDYSKSFSSTLNKSGTFYLKVENDYKNNNYNDEYIRLWWNITNNL